MDLREIAGVAVLVPILTLASVRVSKRLGGWLSAALARSFAQTVSEVVAPDLARLGTRLGTAIDELKEANTEQHLAVEDRLRSVDDRLARLEERATHRRGDDREEP